MLTDIPASVLDLLTIVPPERSTVSEPPAHRHGPVGVDRLRSLLRGLDPTSATYEEWLYSGMATHDGTGGSPEGLDAWDEWSKRDSKRYKGIEDLRLRWNGFSSNKEKKVSWTWLEHRLPAQPDEFETIEASPVDKKPPRFPIEHASEFVKRPPLQWLIYGVVPKAELVTVYGKEKSGKSFFTLDMIAAIPTGTEWRGRKTQKGRVVYVAVEGAAGMRNRMLAHQQQHGSVPEIGIIVERPNLRNDNDYKLLAESINASGGADLIAIDTLAAATPGANENSSEDMGLAIDHCARLSRETGATVLLIHHSGKEAEKGLRGWSGISAAVYAAIEVTKSADGTRVAEVKLMKDGEEGAKCVFRSIVTTDSV